MAIAAITIASCALVDADLYIACSICKVTLVKLLTLHRSDDISCILALNATVDDIKPF